MPACQLQPKTVPPLLLFLQSVNHRLDSSSMQSVELDARTSLFPTVTKSTKVGVKVNENNLGRGPSKNGIDWLPQLVNATIKGVKLRGFTESNIYVMDPSGQLFDAFTDMVFAHYPKVLFWSADGVGRGLACTWDSSDSSLTVIHTNAWIWGRS